ncbi:MAG: RluA family pseudouridine synthase [Deltaproteobacteria bacterium]|nr:RluA family pseudouridine synthase [Deltaproteobacteria bacterium]
MQARTSVEVDSGGAGQRLDRFLAARLEVSRARVRHLLEHGRVFQGGHALALSDKSRLTRSGEAFQVTGSLRTEDEAPTPRADLDWGLVAEGSGWLVVGKPAGRGVHPLSPDQDDTVLNAVIARRPGMLGVGEGGLRSGVVHRLDVETTGALLFATEDEHWRRLRGAFSDHRVRKTYLALVSGRFERARRVDLTLAVRQHRPARVAVVGTSEGRPARQHVTPIRVFSEATLVEVQLETGFLHQIRVSLAHLGHPVLGDTVYGGIAGDAPIRPARTLLHAARLAVDEIDVGVAPPPDFEEAMSGLSELEGG